VNAGVRFVRATVPYRSPYQSCCFASVGALCHIACLSGSQACSAGSGDPLQQSMGASDSDPDQTSRVNEQRRAQLQAARDRAAELPCNEPTELAGRPNVYYELRDYAQPNKLDGSKRARSDVPYLFKSFETGQARPPRPGTKNAQLPRAATIHEYLDWTVTAQGSQALDELVRSCLALHTCTIC